MSVRHGDHITNASPNSIVCQGGGATVRIGTYAPQIHLHVHVHTGEEGQKVMGVFQRLAQRLFGKREHEIEMSPEQAVKFLTTGEFAPPTGPAHSSPETKARVI